MRIILLVIFFFPVYVFANSCSLQNECRTVATKIIDGDTIEIETGEKVRYIGIDAPEKEDRELAKKATDKNRELVEGKELLLIKDVSDKDKYGRLLRYVYTDVFINEVLVKDGFAKALTIKPDISKEEIFIKAEMEARSNKLVIWEDAYEVCKKEKEAIQNELGMCNKKELDFTPPVVLGILIGVIGTLIFIRKFKIKL